MPYLLNRSYIQACRRGLCFALMLFPAALRSNAQLSGSYSWFHGYGTNDIKFFDDHKFNYTFSNCKGKEEGSGTFFIKNDILQLDFKDTLPVSKQKVIRYKISKIAAGSFVLTGNYPRAWKQKYVPSGTSASK